MNWKKWLLVGSIALNVGLLTGLLAGPLLSEAVAQNRATNSAGGGFILAAARTRTTQQNLYVVDTRSKRMIVYGSQSGRGPLKPIDGRDLSLDFGAGFTGDVIILPFELSDSIEGVAIVDPVGKKMFTYASSNLSKLSLVDSRDLGKEFEK